MSNLRAIKVSTGPSFCHDCNKLLQRAPGRGLGLFYAFVLQHKVSGLSYRFHGDCARRLLGSEPTYWRVVE